MMKKTHLLLTYLCLLLILIAVPLIACATETDTEPAETTEPTEDTQVLYTWESLGTYTGAYAVTLVLAPFLKKLLDKKKKHYLELYAIIVAFLLLFGAAIFTDGLTLKSILLLTVNAIVVGMAVYGTKTADDKRRERRAARMASQGS